MSDDLHLMDEFSVPTGPGGAWAMELIKSKRIQEWLEIGNQNTWISKAVDPPQTEKSFTECHTVQELWERLNHGNAQIQGRQAQGKTPVQAPGQGWGAIEIRTGSGLGRSPRAH